MAYSCHGHAPEPSRGQNQLREGRIRLSPALRHHGSSLPARSAAARASSPRPSAPHLRPFPSSVRSPSPRRALTLVVVAVAFSRPQRATRRRALLRRAAPPTACPSPYPAAPRRMPQWLTHATGMLQSPAAARISHGKVGFGFLRRCAATGVRRRHVPLPPRVPSA